MGFFKDFKAFLLKGDIVNLCYSSYCRWRIWQNCKFVYKRCSNASYWNFIRRSGFSDLSIQLKEAVGETPAVTINYGSFIQTVIDFVIIGFCIFIVLKAYERTQKKDEPAPVAPSGPTQEELLTEIRDILKNK